MNKNEALKDETSLARREKDDLAELLLHPEARKNLQNMMERSAAFDDFLLNAGFERRVETTTSLRKCLGDAIQTLNVKSLFDIPSGSSRWQHLIPGIDSVVYVGADMNPRSLEKAKQRKENQAANMNFMLFDAVHFPLRRAFDLILYRDVIEQQRVQDTLTSLRNFKRSGSTFIAVSYWPSSTKTDNEAAYRLDHAGWYEPNLLKQPFNFPEPLFSCENEDQGSRYRHQSRLGFWRLADLPVTEQSVKDAAPELHPEITDFSPELYPHVHFIHSPKLAGRSRHGSHARDSLNELFNFFGDTLTSSDSEKPRSQSLRGPSAVADHQDPFDGMLSNWLGTTGPVQMGLPSKRPGHLSTLFDQFRSP